MGELLSVAGLGYGYRKKRVLHEISFTVEKGAICGLLGPNASGKTTLLKCINGVLTARPGEVNVHGKNIGDMSRQEIARLMAVVPQQMTLAFAFTALQMVVMGRAAELRARWKWDAEKCKSLWDAEKSDERRLNKNRNKMLLPGKV